MSSAVLAKSPHRSYRRPASLEPDWFVNRRSLCEAVGMTTTPTYDDAKLILRLYEMRRDDKMRTARDWFAQNFHFKTMEDYNRQCPASSSMKFAAVTVERCHAGVVTTPICTVATRVFESTSITVSVPPCSSETYTL